MNRIDEYTKAVIISLWRNGNKVETIMWLLNIQYWKIDKIIEDYKKINK